MSEPPELPPARALRVLARLPELFEAWEAFRGASTPVSLADALVVFDNAMTHLMWEHAGDGDEDDDDVELNQRLLATREDVARLTAERDEARAWARGYWHGMFVRVDTDHPPEWLTAPLELDGE